MKNRLTLFKKGHYINNVRAAYEDLLCIGGASANKIEKVVHIVLNKMQGWGWTDFPKQLLQRIWRWKQEGLHSSTLLLNCQGIVKI